MKDFLQGLLVAAIGGALGVVNDPHAIFNNPRETAKTAAGGALIAVAFWLVKGPRGSKGVSQVINTGNVENVEAPKSQ